MYLLVLGIVFLLLKYLEIGFVTKWEWWQVLLPFGLAVCWWVWADWSGYTKRKAIEEIEQRKKDRIDKGREALRGPRRR